MRLPIGWLITALTLTTAATAQRVNLEDLFARGPHIGSVEEALVGIEVTNVASDDSVRQIRRGCGFVLRCDGFVLAPSALFDDTITVAGKAETTGKQRIVIVLYPGTDREQRVTGRRPRYMSSAIGYAALKLDGVHVPALQTVLPDSLKPDDAVTIAWTAWDSSAHRFQTPERRTVFPASPSDIETEPASADAPQWFTALKEPLADVTAGAVVLDSEGKAVGLVTRSGTAQKCEGFTTFAALDRVTNCVTPQSARTAHTPSDIGKGTDEQVIAAADTPMVSVPGGPLSLPAAVLKEQPDMERTGVACVAPFQIDRTEVTNAQYLAFWESLPTASRRKLSYQVNYYPFGWAKSGPPFPPELGNLPVLGVSLTGAKAYAKAVGKRLPTPYEWCMAALGPKGERPMPEWAQRYVSERNRVWERVRDAHIEYAREHPEVRQPGVFLASPYHLPWIARTGLLNAASAWSKNVVETLTDPLWAMWRDLPYILVVGTRAFDVSPSDAYDMILNATELVASYPGAPARGADRYMEMSWQHTPPRRDDTWMVRRIEALLDNEGRLPPLSRLHRRALFGPTAEDLLMWFNLNETTEMLGPLVGWQLRMGTGKEVAAATWVRGADPNEKWGMSSGYALWREMPRRYRQEMGRLVPLNAPDAHVRPGPQLFFVSPVGFRCAR